jgi:hypothetical protein
MRIGRASCGACEIGEDRDRHLAKVTPAVEEGRGGHEILSVSSSEKDRNASYRFL